MTYSDDEVMAKQATPPPVAARDDKGSFTPGASVPHWEGKFWARVGPAAADACWEWRGARNANGYGTLHPFHRSPTWLAHRLSFVLAHGRDPLGLICHHCDNPGCVNPAHLYDGTHQTNTRDKVARGRTSRLPGELNPSAKLTTEGAVALLAERAAGAGCRSLARKYGVSRSTVRRIVRGEKWTHVAA